MIAIRADGNSTVGMGHMMRCLSIADCLKRHGENVVFIIAKDSNDGILKERNYAYYRLKRNTECGWDGSEVAEWMQDNGCKKILIDTYRINESIFATIHQVGKIIYIDDLYAFDYECDAVINYNVEAELEKYTLTNYEKKLYLGTGYFPLREEFCNEVNNRITEHVSNVLIATGSTDNQQIAYSMLQLLAPKYRHINFQLLLGNFYDEEYKVVLKEKFQKYFNVEFLPWGQNMAQVLKKCELVIAPGSTMIFEALSMNVPCISFEFSDNQHKQCVVMNDKEMVPYAGRVKDIFFAEKLQTIFENELCYSSRMYRKEKFGKYFDKKGTKRIVETILEV